MKSWKLKSKHAMLGFFCILGTSTALLGQELVSTNSESFWDRSPLYRAQELSLGLFGSGALGQDTLDHLTGERFAHHLRLGAGADADFFLTRYLGVGVEAWSESTHHSFVNDVSGDLIARIPIDHTCIAPYGFLGGGREFEPVLQWDGYLGAGVEFRFCRHFSFFVDGRYVFAQTSQNYGLGRAGLRLSF
jgi:hypothetical protein